MRYLLLLMGCFAVYMGTIYNDFVSIPLNWFGSCWENVRDETGAWVGEPIPDCVCPYGMDPKWYIAYNELIFFNSYKMKLSVIMGVTQMIFGVLLKGFNCI